MPRITVSVSQTDTILNYDVDGSMTLQTLKEFITAETGADASRLVLWHNGQPLGDDTQTISSSNIHDDDMLVASPRPQQHAPAPSTTPSSTRQSASAPTDAAISQQAESFRQQLLTDTALRTQVAAQLPQLAAAASDPQAFEQIFRTAYQQRRAQQAAADAELARLEADPLSEENQRLIAERIRLENLEKEFQSVVEEDPELLGRVVMLYINVKVNGHPVKAFVDSGAQATIISPSCAEACGITHLIDTRWAGIARGVGTAKILGRVHRAAVQFGDAEFNCAFTVMEGKDVDMLLGLDMLKRYRARIDLDANRLVFMGNVSLPFLGEAEIPKTEFSGAEGAAEPTIQGPGGAQIGAQSGALKSVPGSSSGVAGGGGAGGSHAGGAAGSSSTRQGPAGQAQGSSFAGQGRTLGGAPAAASARPGGPARPPAPTPAAGNPGFPQKDIDTLMSLGASREMAVRALEATGGNVEYAAAYVFQEL